MKYPIGTTFRLDGDEGLRAEVVDRLDDGSLRVKWIGSGGQIWHNTWTDGSITSRGASIKVPESKPQVGDVYRLSSQGESTAAHFKIHRDLGNGRYDFVVVRPDSGRFTSFRLGSRWPNESVQFKTLVSKAESAEDTISKDKVLAAVLQAQKDNGFCDQGVNDFLTGLGIERPKKRLRVSFEVDADNGSGVEFGEQLISGTTTSRIRHFNPTNIKIEDA